MGSTTIAFYKNEYSIVAFMIFNGVYSIFSFSLNSEITPNDGLNIEFASEEEVYNWLKKNGYVNIPMKFNADSQFIKNATYK